MVDSNSVSQLLITYINFLDAILVEKLFLFYSYLNLINSNINAILCTRIIILDLFEIKHYLFITFFHCHVQHVPQVIDSLYGSFAKE
nr:hypothetical protein Itr_chr15CG01650 [Ipomoea trifida]